MILLSKKIKRFTHERGTKDLLNLLDVLSLIESVMDIACEYKISEIRLAILECCSEISKLDSSIDLHDYFLSQKKINSSMIEKLLTSSLETLNKLEERKEG